MTVAGNGGLRALVALSRCDDLELRILAAGSLRHLSLNTRVKRPMLEEGALGPLLRSVHSLLAPRPRLVEVKDANRTGRGVVEEQGPSEELTD